MSGPIRSSAVAVLLAVTLAGGRAWAGHQGQEDLDRAIEVKLTAKTVSDLAEVIPLVRSGAITIDAIKPWL